MSPVWRRRPAAATCAALVALPAVPAAALALGTQAARRLAYSTASNHVVQRQPRPGSCHAIGSGRNARPDPRCTPGSLSPLVTQATIARTICARGWTARVRPPASVTEREKRASMAAYGDRGRIGAYEYDHLVPLELGGATNDPRNLWPEPEASPNAKDEVEGQLKRAVCAGRITLTSAQNAIAANWLTAARLAAGARTRRRAAAPSPAPRRAQGRL